jgi:replicative DNA helicase
MSDPRGTTVARRRTSYGGTSGEGAGERHVSVAEFRSGHGSREDVGREVRDLASEFERTPPQDLQAEQSVLGGMMLSKDAIADVVETVKGNDFYKPAHEVIFDAVLDLYGRGEPADAVTVAAELTKRGELGRVGGAPYLHTLLQSVPTAANAGYYARIVRERAILRRLVEAGTRIVQLGYATEGGAVDEIVDRAQAEVYAVTERRTSEDYLPLSEIMEGTLDEIEAISSRSGEMVGVPTGFSDLDQLTNGLHPGQMIVVAARPGLGKSTFGLDVARSAAIRHRLTTAIFSLEMSRNEITMRLLSAEAKISLHHMRTGGMNDDDWNRLARRMGEVSSAPLFIDDSPNLSMMEIRAKCRRLKQRHDLRLVIVDYLQLMSMGRRYDSRQQEVSEMSRALKLLAKELEVPVIAISQLNRGAEQRTDKKPQIADLRESGCLTAATRVLRADTGAEVTMGELIASGERDVPVWSLDESLRYVPRTMTHAFCSGRKPVFRLRLASGKQVEATANHPFLTCQGWRALGELAVGDRLAAPRHVPAPLLTRDPWPEAEVVALARAATTGPVPVETFSLPKPQIAVFLRELFTAAGAVSLGAPGELGRVQVAAVRRRRVEDLSRLLLRFGISTRLHADPRRFWVLTIDERDDLRRFLQEIGMAGAHAAGAEALLERVLRTIAVPADRELHDRLHSAATVAAGGGSRMARVAAALDEADLDVVATNDVLWDPVVAIEPLGEQDVFDATVLGTHNFVADGVAVHNSIEQDADMVILLHREDAYEKESPRAGEADFIVAKHRNGPTDTITVAFQGHYSRFVDMAGQL